MTGYWILFGLMCLAFFVLGCVVGYTSRINDEKAGHAPKPPDGFVPSMTSFFQLRRSKRRKQP